MSHPRRRSAADGGRPLGLDSGGLLIDGLAYLAIKRRLALVQPSEPGETTPEQRRFVGAEPVGVADLSRPRVGGWRQPTQLPAWSRTDDLDEYEDAPGDELRIVMSVGTTRRLEEIEGDGRGD